jgi:fluoroacetyl-CoA thioesterase
MPKLTLQTGLTFQQKIVVTENLVVPAMAHFYAGFVDMPKVFATAFLVGFAEWTCVEALKRFLDDEERTVGTYIDISHTAATPLGMEVVANVELIEIEGRKLRFKIVCSDEKEIISEGFHERFIINYNKFMERVEKKKK